jgi:uncharacterized cysteine cluster protein YcgN (CxxCxxCC family)
MADGGSLAPALAPDFWVTKPLNALSRAEWEALCDGCGKCCLHKLEDGDTGVLYYTDVVCRLLDRRHCRCTRYRERSDLVPDCLTLTPDNIMTLHWLPQTCAYRLLAQGRALPDWHPLVSGDPESVHRAGQSVRGKVVSEDAVDDLEDHVVDWLL